MVVVRLGKQKDPEKEGPFTKDIPTYIDIATKIVDEAKQ